MTADTDGPAPAAERAGGPAPRRGRLGPPPWLALFFLLPALLFLGIYVVYPILFSVYRSLWDAPGTEFVGLDNYARMFTRADTFIALRNNVVWIAVAPAVVTVAGLVFAVLTERIRWATAFKIVVFMPMAISFLASGVIFRLVYEQDPDRGLANAVITTVQDTVAPTGAYPGANPREGVPLEETPQGGYRLAEPVAPGDTVTIPLVGVNSDELASGTEHAARPQADPDGVAGTVWVDFTRGGGGREGEIDATETGLPALRVEAVRDGEAVATATTAEDGTFMLTGLEGGGYTLRLAASNFSEPYNGLTWLGPTLITPSIIAAYLWVWAGFAMVLIAAGLSAIPREALEAARVDGATEWQVFRRVTVPLLSPVLMVVFVTLMIYVLKIFDLVFVIAPGSVRADANVLALEMWQVSFGINDQGLGSALAVFLLLLVVPAMVFQIRRFRREDS
ncbi:ABC transporter permease subunit [Streptomonospora wellingtoniae]|uniref:ABC transporter permease subunit n=1 Tax=Streptomonospora wellingtoniae TaxID=3075544 RepID=A0ABU2KU99_9ACTN|nr:ABC transporter permease subunit [Streptomonospora sp. DSM 45055]MDT0302698.1 ABC transporter permease subunit [Streptomonospora sp. DSM 45055]